MPTFSQIGRLKRSNNKPILLNSLKDNLGEQPNKPAVRSVAAAAAAAAPAAPTTTTAPTTAPTTTIAAAAGAAAAVPPPHIPVLGSTAAPTTQYPGWFVWLFS